MADEGARYHDGLPRRWSGVVEAQHRTAALVGPAPRVSLLAHGRPLVGWGVVLPSGVAPPDPGARVHIGDGALAWPGAGVQLDEAVDLSVRAGPVDRAVLAAWLEGLPDLALPEPVERALASLVPAALYGTPDPLPLCGLGPGSTPLGDDSLVGIAAGLWRLAPERVPLLGLDALEGRTTPTSVEMLGHAAHNTLPEPLALVASALGQPDPPPLDGLLAVGASSGEAMLAGLAAVVRALVTPRSSDAR